MRPCNHLSEYIKIVYRYKLQKKKKIIQKRNTKVYNIGAGSAVEDKE